MSLGSRLLTPAHHEYGDAAGIQLYAKPVRMLTLLILRRTPNGQLVQLITIQTGSAN